MLKNIVASSVPEVIGCAGGQIDMAVKECQFLATILDTPVKLNFNGFEYMVDKEGKSVKMTSATQDILNLIK